MPTVVSMRAMINVHTMQKATMANELRNKRPVLVTFDIRKGEGGGGAKA